MKFEIRQSKNKQYFFRIKSSNGEILAHSEEYHNLTDCYNAVLLIRTDAKDAEITKVFSEGHTF